MSSSRDEEFERLLNKLSVRLGRDSLPDLKRQCTAVLSENRLRDVSSSAELFLLLQREGLLSRYNWPQLVELMNGIGRNDLAERVLLHGKRQTVQATPDALAELPAECDDTTVVFSFGVGCNLTESIPSLIAALNMLIFETGSSTIWFIGAVSPVQAVFRLSPANAERVMDVVNQRPLWLLQQYVMHVQYGECKVLVVDDARSLESSLQSNVSMTSEPRFQRIVGQLISKLTDREEVIRRCSLVLDPRNFQDALSMDEVFEELICRRLLTPYNFVQMAELMRHVGRSDLARKVDHKSRRYGFEVAEDESVLPKQMDRGRVVVRFDMTGRQPMSEKIGNMMDGFSMILFKTAHPILWYLACISDSDVEEHHLYFVTEQKNLRRIMDSATNGHPWLHDLGIVTVLADTERVALAPKDPEERVQAERNKRLFIAAHKGSQNLVETFLGLGGSVNFKDADEATALHRACHGNNFEIAELLVGYGSDVNASTEEELLQPLHIAADKGNLRIVELLLKSGAKINALGWGDVTPLHIAAAKGHMPVVEFLVTRKTEKADVMASDQDGDHPLHYAALEGHADVVSFLIENGAHVNVKSKNSQTPLHWASGNNRLTVVEVLCDAGANPNCRDELKCTPLHWAADGGNDRMSGTLVSRGCDVNAQNDSKQSALHWAGTDGHVTLSRVLLEYGSKVNLHDKNGVTPFQFAVSEGHTEVVKLMVAHGANINEQNENGCTVLHLAALNGHYVIADLLLKKGCKVDKRTNEHYTPLHYASMAGHTNIVELLLNYRAEVNAIDSDGWNPLHVASFQNHPAVIEVLLQHKSDIYAEDKQGRTAFQLAHLKDSQAVVDLFERKGLAVTVL